MKSGSRKPRAYEALVADIRQQLLAGSLSPGSYLPTERELGEKYEVSSRAVREGLARLEAEGLIRREQGRGTVVLERPEVASETQHENVAVIFQGRVRDPSSAEEFDCLQQAFQAEGYGTTLYVADGDPEKEAEIVRRLVKEGVSGVVLYSSRPSDSDSHLRAARESGMRIAVFDHDFPGVDCNFLGIDDHLAAFEATEHLIRLGCRELLFINSERNWTTHVLRERGFVEAASKFASDIPRTVVRLPNAPSVQDLGVLLRERLAASLSGMQRPLGVVAWWDEMALKAMDCLREAGWSVPVDAKVIGFSNDLSGEVAEIPLTTMDIPRGEIARLAASALISQLRDPSRKSQRIRLKARLIIRESCGTYSCRLDGSGLGREVGKPALASL